MRNQNHLIIGTRSSKLALWQAEYIAVRLRDLHPGLEVNLKHFVTRGDKVLDKPLPEIGGKGLFTAELEEALRSGEIDLAVHSLKDLPTEMAADFTLGAIPERASYHDALISRSGAKLLDLPQGATIGTSSLRRIAQIKAIRPDIHTETLRGNVPTRIEKALDPNGRYAAIILAEAGLDRLGLAGHITEVLDTKTMLPAPAQGALGVQCRTDDEHVKTLLAPLDHFETRACVTAERAFLEALDSGCRLPVAALALFKGENLWLYGRVASVTGEQVIAVDGVWQKIENAKDMLRLGYTTAAEAKRKGAQALLDEVRREIES